MRKVTEKEKDGKRARSSNTSAGSKSKKNSGGSKKGTDKAKKSSRSSADSKYDVYDYDCIYEETDEGVDAPAKKVKTPPDVSAPKYQAIMLLMAAAALFVALCYIFPDFCGVLGKGIKNFLYGSFSGAAVLTPFLLLIQVVYFKRDLKNGTVALKFLFSFAVTLLLSVMLHAIFCIFSEEVASLSFADVKSFYANGKEFIGGGVLGGVIGALLVTAVGIPGTMIFSILLMLIFGVFLFGLTPGVFWKRIAFYFFRFCEERQKRRKARGEQNARARRDEEATNEYKCYSPVTDNSAQTARYDTRYDTRGNTNEIRSGRADIDEIFRKDLVDNYPAKPKTKQHQEKAAVSHSEDSEKEEYIPDKEFRGESVAAYMRRNAATAEPVSKNNGNEPKSCRDIKPIKPQTEKAERTANLESEYYKKYDTAAAVFENTSEDDICESVMPENVSGSIAHSLGVTEDKIEIISADIDGTAFSGTTEKYICEEETDAEYEDENCSEEETFGYDGTVCGNEAQPIMPPEHDKEPIERDALNEELRRTLDITRRKMQSEPVSPSPRTETIQYAPSPVQSEPEEKPSYVFPPFELLKQEPVKNDNGKAGELQMNAEKLVETLRSFNVRAHVVDVASGPTVTRYEIGLEAGTRVRQIMNLVDDISYALATNGVRIEGVIPGKSAIGIEVPNRSAETVYLRTLLENPKFKDAKSKLTAALGRSVSGEPLYIDIAKMPHLMIAGTTGSGKSVCINTMLISLLYKSTPEEVKLVLIDPKKVELNVYNGIPHLLVPVVFDPKKAAGALHWCVTEMERRFDLIESMNVRNIAGYNEVIADDPTKEKLPQIVIVIDELADLMMTAANEVETSICRIAQKARAAGMHLIIGTQRPSVDVITGLIKANIPSRIAFTVMSQVDSRTIIDSAGAEKLIGRGDMLYAPVGCTKPMRAQGAFVSDSELEGVIEFIKEHSTEEEKRVENSRAIMERIEKEAALCGKKGKSREDSDDDSDSSDVADPKLKSAIKLAVDSGKISTSLLQRKLSLGYGRAAKLIDEMERRGIVGAPEGQKPREVLITKEQYLEMMMNEDPDSQEHDEHDLPEDEI